ncbi:MAG: 3-deoxy-D-manno-octulosonate 8-phosphate phosphatase [Persephonella sp.]|nr:MAG: 3-deoxy-D-manno-octulosonate 8-phosphate phosphatase [Persephonella sp.]
MEDLKKVKWIILDVDGVLTDGKIIYDSEGREIKVFCVKDGYGIHMAKKYGINFAIISGRKSKVVDIRAKELGIEEVYQLSTDKVKDYLKIKEKYKFNDDEVIYIGDDLQDIPLLKMVGFPITVPNSPKEVKKVAVYITSRNGGDGAVREVIDLVLRAKGLLNV